jgi:ABC-type transport system substrate-binding protein
MPPDRGTLAQSGSIMRTHRTLVAVLTVVISIGALMAMVPGAGSAAETPRRGGGLLAAVAADAPSLDPHQEETFATVELVAPCYSTLLQQVFESRGF